MMKHIKMMAIGLIAFASFGCAMAQSPVTGFIYTDVKGPVSATEAYGGSARGEACASSILGIYGSGDASVDAAKKNGGVVQVNAVDSSAYSILGLFAKYCTIVYGKKGSGSAAAPAKPSEG